MNLVVLISGQGSNLAALIEACADERFGGKIVGVVSDRKQAGGLTFAEKAGIPTRVVPPANFNTRPQWDSALTEVVAKFQPDLIVCAGFMRLLGESFLAKFPHRVINTHPSLLPAFPGISGVKDALQYGVKITGATLFFVDAGIDTGQIIAQVAVLVKEGDTEQTLSARVKAAETTQLVAATGRLLRNGWEISGRGVSFKDPQ